MILECEFSAFFSFSSFCSSHSLSLFPFLKSTDELRTTYIGGNLMKINLYIGKLMKIQLTFQVTE